MNNYLTSEQIQKGLNLIGVNPLQFYKKGRSRLAFMEHDLICEVCNLGEWREGRSYAMMYEDAFGKEGLEFIRSLPVIINMELQG